MQYPYHICAVGSHLELDENVHEYAVTVVYCLTKCCVNLHQFLRHVCLWHEAWICVVLHPIPEKEGVEVFDGMKNYWNIFLVKMV